MAASAESSILVEIDSAPLPLQVQTSIVNARTEQECATEPSDLQDALLRGDWRTCKEAINKRPDIARSAVTPSGETPLMVAIKGGHMHLVKKLIKHTSIDDLALTDISGNTALHAAAMHGNIKVAGQLVQKNPDLRDTQNGEGMLPVDIAVMREDIVMTYFLWMVMRLLSDQNNQTNLFKREASPKLIHDAIRSGMYELAHEWLQPDARLAWEENFNPLEVMAENPIAFHDGPYFNFWEPGERFIDLLRLMSPLLHLGLTLTPEKAPDTTVVRVLYRKVVHDEALRLLKFLCSSSIKEKLDACAIFKEPFLLAARTGLEKIVTEILDSFPDAVKFTDEERHSIFHIAVMYRQENIFKIACQKNPKRYKTLLLERDIARNNILHLAGLVPRQDRLDLNPHSFLQMQSELRWFKELEKLVTLKEIKGKNNEGKTPLMIFHQDHADLASKEIQWMTGMATACSVAASIISTVAFAAAITVPRGNNNTGVPIFLKRKSFLIFVISDALALFASITTLLSFLSIFTCRFGVDDFLYSLPNRVIIGLISLFLSIIYLVVAFSCTSFLVSAQKNCLMLIPIIGFACVPVILYTSLQLPSFFKMIKATYFTRDFLLPAT